MKPKFVPKPVRPLADLFDAVRRNDLINVQVNL